MFKFVVDFLHWLDLLNLALVDKECYACVSDNLQRLVTGSCSQYQFRYESPIASFLYYVTNIGLLPGIEVILGPVEAAFRAGLHDNAVLIAHLRNLKLEQDNEIREDVSKETSHTEQLPGTDSCRPLRAKDSTLIKFLPNHTNEYVLRVGNTNEVRSNCETAILYGTRIATISSSRDESYCAYKAGKDACWPAIYYLFHRRRFLNNIFLGAVSGQRLDVIGCLFKMFFVPDSTTILRVDLFYDRPYYCILFPHALLNIRRRSGFSNLLLDTARNKKWNMLAFFLDQGFQIKDVATAQEMISLAPISELRDAITNRLCDTLFVEGLNTLPMTITSQLNDFVLGSILERCTGSADYIVRICKLRNPTWLARNPETLDICQQLKLLDYPLLIRMLCWAITNHNIPQLQKLVTMMITEDFYYMLALAITLGKTEIAGQFLRHDSDPLVMFYLLSTTDLLVMQLNCYFLNAQTDAVMTLLRLIFNTIPERYSCVVKDGCLLPGIKELRCSNPMLRD